MLDFEGRYQSLPIQLPNHTVVARRTTRHVSAQLCAMRSSSVPGLPPASWANLSQLGLHTQPSQYPRKLTKTLWWIVGCDVFLHERLAHVCQIPPCLVQPFRQEPKFPLAPAFDGAKKRLAIMLR